MSEDPLVTAQREEDSARQAADRKADTDNLQTMQSSFYQLAAGSLERTKFAAELVQKSSAAIGTVYTGILALVYSTSGVPLPMRGVIAPIFLGIALVLSTAYLAYVAPPNEPPVTVPDESMAPVPKSYARLNTFIIYTSNMAQRRAWMMRASVMALGVGVVGISLPFLHATTTGPQAEPQTASAVPWPTPMTNMSDAHSVILYKAQVDEVLNIRAKAAAEQPPTDTLSSFIFPLLAGLLIVSLGAALPAVTRRDGP
ncbi:hypothetical protein [Arthrobacter sp. NicSoilB8]|uniref:hypothetical protein n=1 Tax=Arthrobacter sp. NicSoilB8 TaxID=2830998 RepID=UPI001CC52CE3|nr:hypothetical protein [Arthrobacter sp. NicSoilB8]BCW72420.1 hypothetical protein NicSoilB8_34640 [Arthrobacter sp. NicSoilB8]